MAGTAGPAVRLGGGTSAGRHGPSSVVPQCGTEGGLRDLALICGGSDRRIFAGRDAGGASLVSCFCLDSRLNTNAWVAVATATQASRSDRRVPVPL